MHTRTRKLPTRPDTEISQTYNSGIVQVYGVQDSAAVGHSPVEERTLKCALRYEEQRLGINRLYLSRQNQAEIVRVIRVPLPKGIPLSSQDVARTEDGTDYRIDTVQVVQNCWPPSVDLSLRAIEPDYDKRMEEGDENDLV